MDEQQTVGVHDPRIAAWLADPYRFFADARQRAWLEAGREVRLDLARRERRRNGRARRRDL